MTRKKKKTHRQSPKHMAQENYGWFPKSWSDGSWGQRSVICRHGMASCLLYDPVQTSRRAQLNTTCCSMTLSEPFKHDDRQTGSSSYYWPASPVARDAQRMSLFISIALRLIPHSCDNLSLFIRDSIRYNIQSLDISLVHHNIIGK